MAKAPRKYPHPMYIKPGTEREMQLRVSHSARQDLEHMYKLCGKKFANTPSLGVFVAFLASIGADHISHELGIPGAGKLQLAAELQEELEARNRRPIKQELLTRYEQVYRGLPPAGSGEFIAYAARRGGELVRDTYIYPRK